MASAPVALITAGSAGLGAATARLFAQNGYRVVVNYSSNQERAQTLVKDLQGLSSLPADPETGSFCAIKADLASRDDIKRLVGETVDKMGRLDVIFSNGGWTQFRGLASLDGKSVMPTGNIAVQSGEY